MLDLPTLSTLSQPVLLLIVAIASYVIGSIGGFYWLSFVSRKDIKRLSDAKKQLEGLIENIKITWIWDIKNDFMKEIDAKLDDYGTKADMNQLKADIENHKTETNRQIKSIRLPQTDHLATKQELSIAVSKIEKSLEQYNANIYDIHTRLSKVETKKQKAKELDKDMLE